jgi:hypothetical protein
LSKAKNAAPLSVEEILARAKESMTPEQLASLGKQLGQNQGGRGDGIPKLFRNSQERKDSKGVKISKGNWVIGQKRSVIDGKDILEDAGVDLGEEIEVELLLVVDQYSYYSPDPKKRCSSNICFSIDDVQEATGSTLGHVCSSGLCPRRAAGLDSKEKCGANKIAYVRMPSGTKLPDGTDCLFAKVYFKGENYMPFKEYVSDILAGVPYLLVKTKIDIAEEKVHGSVLYYINSFTVTGQADDVADNQKVSTDIREKLAEAIKNRKTKGSGKAGSSDAAKGDGGIPGLDDAATPPAYQPPAFNPDDDIPF